MDYFNYVVYKTAYYVLRFLDVAILARVVLSWLPVSNDNQLVRLIYQVTEPILAPIRSFIQRSSIGRSLMFDFSPLVAIILISLLENLLRSLLL